MKKFIYLLLIILGPKLLGQTDSLEKAALYKKLMDKEISEPSYARTGSQWMELINRVKYPDLPLDKNGQVHYTVIKQFIGKSKEELFNRTREWLAINYGLLPVNMYSDVNDGIIIVRNSLNLFTNYSCVFTAVISFKEDKIKFEMISISYQAYLEADYASGVPERTVTFSINEVYPIILKKQIDWNLDLSLFKGTNKLFTTETKNLEDYILSYDSSDKFQNP
jgi:hypothetical protein